MALITGVRILIELFRRWNGRAR